MLTQKPYKVWYYNRYFYLIYVNNIVGELLSNAKLFANNILLFSVVHNTDSSEGEVNDGPLDTP